MKLLDKYYKAIHEIYEYFDYTTEGKILPLEDYTEFYWKISDVNEGFHVINYSSNIEDEEYEFSDKAKNVYRGEEYTMIDIIFDDEECLCIFANNKEILEQEE